jgi:hypothetical protein
MYSVLMKAVLTSSLPKEIEVVKDKKRRLTTVWFIHSQQKRGYPAFNRLICRPLKRYRSTTCMVVVGNAVAAHHESFHTFVLIKLIKILEGKCGRQRISHALLGHAWRKQCQSLPNTNWTVSAWTIGDSTASP